MKSQEAQSRGLRSRALSALSVALLMIYGTALAAAPDPASGGDPGVTTIRYAKGHILVQPRAGLSHNELDKIVKGHGGRRGQHMKQINVHIIELPPQANELAVAKALQHNRHIKFAELDQLVEPTMSVGDPFFTKAWHLAKIGAPTAWDTATGAGVTIAILDSGVDATHPDLQANLVPGWNIYDNNSNTSDVNGHGTLVAGIAGATGNNGVGVVGVSFKSKIMPIRVSDASGYALFSAIASGISWAADHGAKVANLSFAPIAGSATVQSAAQYMRGKGGVVVVAGGNAGTLENINANSSLTAVSATDSADAKTSWSSYGNYVDVAAPGIGIYTTVKGGGYGAAWGTSMSAPVTAGIYALMLSANPALSPSTLDNILFTTAVDLGAAGFDTSFGNGRVRADAAVSKAKTTVAADTQSPSTSILNPAPGSKEAGLVSIDATASDNMGVARVDLYAGTTLLASDTSAPYAFSWDTSAWPDGTISLYTKAIDTNGNVGTSSAVSVTIANDTVSPTVNISNPAAGSAVSGTVSISVNASDNKQVAKISLLIDGKEVAVSYGATLSYVWSVASATMRKKSTSTTSTITARAYDSANNMGTASVTVSRQ